MTLTRILSIVFLVSALGLGYLLYKSVDDVMQQEKLIAATEARIIEKLQMLRDAQIAYLASNGQYAGSWDELKKFIQDGKIWIVQRTETTKLLEYGKEEITVTLDTLGSVMVMDSLFNERRYPNFNLENLHIVPGSGGKQFEFFADKVERTQRQIPVFEIRDPDPMNPKRRLNNKEKALRIGSRTDSSTSGNWE
ncbi:hypothetical protein C943_04384 [Mariniradius saccharolyticus AK6]|uniref:Uncharacterized protein n=2 Tax=Mariniradius TaxID=1245590 RepID=M7Y8J7_9BACT|nr:MULTISPECIES: hypothetical protein [Mariniradius]EMS33506.1 hypothetical protein C943_04384 [Mariniradius saccharolyticus AK6]MCF1753306.1 hypothetical protein [Mariniradius sediminis]